MGVCLLVLYGKVNEVKGVDFLIFGLFEIDKIIGVNFGLFFGVSKVN